MGGAVSDSEARFDRGAYTSKPEPAPTAGTGDVWSEVISEWDDISGGFPLDHMMTPDVMAQFQRRGRARDAMEARRAFGVEKYGTPLQRDNNRDHLTDCRDEALDLTVYAHCLTTDHVRNPDRVRELAAALLLELF